MLENSAKVVSLAIALGMLSGCAANQEMVEADHLRLQELDKLVQMQGKKILEIEQAANNALAAARSAESTAASAQQAAHKCAHVCEAHMDKMFRKSMMK